jgi:hypothetical protein
VFLRLSLLRNVHFGSLTDILRRETCRPCPLKALEIFPTKSLKSPPLAGLLPQLKSLCVSNLVILRPTVPKFSARSRHYSRFPEKRTGERVRSQPVRVYVLNRVRSNIGLSALSCFCLETAMHRSEGAALHLLIEREMQLASTAQVQTPIRAMKFCRLIQ